VIEKGSLITLSIRQIINLLLRLVHIHSHSLVVQTFIWKNMAVILGS